jgi:hypothetical protein
MAILYDKKANGSLEIQPVMPSLDGPQNAYNVVVREQQEVLFERQYTTYPWSPDGHWNVWRLTRALKLAPRLPGAMTKFNISGSGRPLYKEEVTLRVETGWLNVLLTGYLIEHGHGDSERWKETRFLVEVYLLADPQLEDVRLQSFMYWRLPCKPGDVAIFGGELLTECRTALAMRRELGIPAPADEYVDQ